MSADLGVGIGSMTATLAAAAAALLDTLPLEIYAETVGGRQIPLGTDAEASNSHRRARRDHLVAAAEHAKDFVAAMGNAMQHNRAVARAVELERSAREEAASATSALPLRTLHPRTGNLLRDAEVIPLRRGEALPDELA